MDTKQVPDGLVLFGWTDEKVVESDGFIDWYPVNVVFEAGEAAPIEHFKNGSLLQHGESKIFRDLYGDWIVRNNYGKAIFEDIED